MSWLFHSPHIEYSLIVFAWHFTLYVFPSPVRDWISALPLSPTLRVYIGICRWMSQFIKSMIECSTLFYYNDWTQPIVQHTLTQFIQMRARARVHNSICMRNEMNGAKINIIACCFCFSLQKEEEQEVGWEENNTWKVDNWFSILWFSISLSFSLPVCLALLLCTFTRATVVCPRLRGCCLPPSPLCSWT